MVRLIVIIAICFIACNQAQKPTANLTSAEKNEGMLKNAASIIKDGDIILRCGKDVTSYRIRELSLVDKTYSHAGIAKVTKDGIFIYHITPPDVDEPRSDTLIRLEELRKFGNPQKNFNLAVGRFRLNDEQIRNMLTYLDSLKTSGVSFDFLFDLNSRQKIYCSEMIDDALRAVTNDSIALKRNNLTDSTLIRKVSNYLRMDVNHIKAAKFIPIENIHLNNSFEMISNFKFE